MNLFLKVFHGSFEFDEFDPTKWNPIDPMCKFLWVWTHLLDGSQQGICFCSIKKNGILDKIAPTNPWSSHFCSQFLTESCSCTCLIAAEKSKPGGTPNMPELTLRPSGTMCEYLPCRPWTPSYKRACRSDSRYMSIWGHFSKRTMSLSMKISCPPGFNLGGYSFQISLMGGYSISWQCDCRYSFMPRWRVLSGIESWL